MQYFFSYLGNGLVAARLAIAQQTENSDIESHSLYTYCFPPEFKLDDWDYAGRIWTISARKESSFTTCLASVRHFVRNVGRIRRIPELSAKDVYLFAYFYDRGVQAGIIEWTADHRSGLARVVDYRHAAEKGMKILLRKIYF